MNTVMGWLGSGPKMCLYCKQKPVHQGYDYCGKTCADWAKTNPPPAQNAPPGWGQPTGPPPPGWGYPPGNYGPPPPGPPQQQGPWPPYNQYSQQPPPQAAQPPAAPAPTQGGMCQNCHVKPVFPGHPYCSKTCGASAKKNGAPPPVAQPAAGPPPTANWGGYGPPPQWPPQGPPQQGPPQGWPQGPQPPGGAWGPPPGGQPPWGPPQQGWPQGPTPRRKGRGSNAGRWDDEDDDDDDWPDDDDYRPSQRRPKRASLAQKGTKMCINCWDNPAVGGLEFCSKSCKAEAGAKLQGDSGHRRVNTSARGPPRRRNTTYDDD